MAGKLHLLYNSHLLGPVVQSIIFNLVIVSISQPNIIKNISLESKLQNIEFLTLVVIPLVVLLQVQTGKI